MFQYHGLRCPLLHYGSVYCPSYVVKSSSRFNTDPSVGRSVGLTKKGKKKVTKIPKCHRRSTAKPSSFIPPREREMTELGAGGEGWCGEGGRVCGLPGLGCEPLTHVWSASKDSSAPERASSWCPGGARGKSRGGVKVSECVPLRAPPTWQSGLSEACAAAPRPMRPRA